MYEGLLSKCNIQPISTLSGLPATPYILYNSETAYCIKHITAGYFLVFTNLPECPLILDDR